MKSISKMKKKKSGGDCCNKFYFKILFGSSEKGKERKTF